MKTTLLTDLTVAAVTLFSRDRNVASPLVAIELVAYPEVNLPE